MELVNSAVANVKRNSESKDNKLLSSAAFLVAEEKTQKIMLEPGESIIVSWKRFSKRITYYVKKLKKIIRKYDLETTVYINVISQLKVKIHNVSLKIKKGVKKRIVPTEKNI